MDLTAQSIVVTGGSGFLGSRLVDELERRGCTDVTVPRSSTYDLTETDDIIALYDDAEPDVVIHLAGTVGGIGLMKNRPGEIFYDNAKMAIELQEIARKRTVDKFVSIGSVCAYPKHTPVPFVEDDLWDGYPEETHAPYGIAKKLPLVQAQAYQAQYDFDGIYLLPANLYGPGDDFDPKSSHVIPAIIRKFDQAMRDGKDEITAWGTGEPTREFLYVEDAARAIADATERYDDSEPVNLGTGNDISIAKLVRLIGDLMGFKGDVHWDTSKPDGQPRRRLKTTRAEERFGWTASTAFQDGLEQTIEWYLDNRDTILTE